MVEHDGDIGNGFLLHEENGDELSDSDGNIAPLEVEKRGIMMNFILMSVLFSANHGSVAACLALAATVMGNIGAWQSGALYLAYTCSALFGATYLVKQIGSRDAITTGMALYCVYVICFYVATTFPSVEIPAAVIGALIGGVGGGFLWTAQGSYFGKSCDEYSLASRISTTDSASLLGGIFAFIYLSEEVLLKSLSSALVRIWGYSWDSVFASYSAVCVAATFGMVFVRQYPTDSDSDHTSLFSKVGAAWILLVNDSKMKYMIGFNASFSLTSAFLNSYVSGEVVRMALPDDDGSQVGVLSAITAAVAAIMSILFAYAATKTGKGPILITGAVSFFFVGFIFVLQPDFEEWGWTSLAFVYGLQGIGRATFEGTLRATFVDFFPKEREGAFANIILQTGLSGSLGFFMSYNIPWIVYEWIVMVTAIFAILGYWRAAIIYHEEIASTDQQEEGALV